MNSIVTRLFMAVSVLVFFSALPLRIWPLDLLRAAAWYLSAIHILLLIAMLFLNRAWIASLRGSCVLCMGLAGVLLLWQPVAYMWSEAQGISAGSGTAVKIFVSNVRLLSNRMDGVRTLIEKHDPDLLALLEIDEAWLRALDLSARYSHCSEVPRADMFGYVVCSRLPLTALDLGPPGDGVVTPVYRGVVHVNDHRQFEWWVIHALPPISADWYRHNLLLARRVATEIRNAGQPALVIGDLNATPHMKVYQVLAGGADLRNALAPLGWVSTWNAEFPALRLWLDHVLISAEMYAFDPQIVEIPGSDHWGVIVHVGLSETDSEQ